MPTTSCATAAIWRRTVPGPSPRALARPQVPLQQLPVRGHSPKHPVGQGQARRADQALRKGRPAQALRLGARLCGRHHVRQAQRDGQHQNLKAVHVMGFDAMGLKLWV